MHVPRFIGVVAAAGVLVITSSSGSAWAESQAGGLPAVSNRVSVLEGVAATLQTAVTNLQTSLSALQTSLTTVQTSVTTLQTQVTTLQNADTGLQNALNAESAARKAGDTDLRGLLDQETFARQLTDATINLTLSRLNASLGSIAQVGKAYESTALAPFLVEGQRGTVGVLADVPAGRYFVIAKLGVRNVNHDAEWLCYLHRNDEGFPNVLDISEATTESGIVDNVSNLTLTAVTTLPTQGFFKVTCSTFKSSSDLFWVKITAISVQ